MGHMPSGAENHAIARVSVGSVAGGGLGGGRCRRDCEVPIGGAESARMDVSESALDTIGRAVASRAVTGVEMVDHEDAMIFWNSESTSFSSCECSQFGMGASACFFIRSGSPRENACFAVFSWRYERNFAPE